MPSAAPDTRTVLEVTDLATSFYTHAGWLRAVDGVSLSIGRGEILGVVGESGCGKSVMAMSLLRLHDPRRTRYEGRARLAGTDLLALDAAQMQHCRGRDVAMIFQDPLNSLNPLMTIGRQIAEPLRIHRGMGSADARAQALQLLELTGIPDPAGRYEQFPHELSGGMRQRVMIAIALACEPKLLIADEPTTALDVTIQAQVLELIRALRDRTRMGVLFITHDLGVVSELCDRVAVMYLGQVIESAPVRQFFERPRHPYSRGLLASMPARARDPRATLATIAGAVPPLTRVPAGCRFAPRCAHATAQCEREAPPPVLEDGHLVRCWNLHLVERAGQRDAEALHA